MTINNIGKAIYQSTFALTDCLTHSKDTKDYRQNILRSLILFENGINMLSHAVCTRHCIYKNQ